MEEHQKEKDLLESILNYTKEPSFKNYYKTTKSFINYGKDMFLDATLGKLTNKKTSDEYKKPEENNIKNKLFYGFKGKYNENKEFELTENNLKGIKLKEDDKNIYIYNKDKTINRTINKEENNILTNHYLNRYRQTMKPFTETEINQMKYLEPISVLDYIRATKEINKLKPILEKAVDDNKKGNNLTEEELNALKEYSIYQANIMTRGVSFGGQLINSVVTNLETNLRASIENIIANVGLKVAENMIGGSVASSVGNILRAKKVYKTAKTTEKALKYFILPLAQSGIDYGVKTYLFDKVPYFRQLGSGTKENQFIEKKLAKTLQITDKGELFISQISPEQENFLKKQVSLNNFVECWSERALDPIFEGIGSFLDGKFKKNIAWQVLKQANNLPKIASTTFDGFFGEHLEEIFGITMNHLLKANDPETTISKALKEYIEPNNFTLSSLNILIAGGLFHKMSNKILGKEVNGKSISENIIKTYLETKGLNKEEIENKLNKLDETRKDKLAMEIWNKEDKQQQINYENNLDEIRKQVSKYYDDEYTKNYMALLDSMIASTSIRVGKSRFDVFNKLKLEINNNLDNNNNIDNNKINHRDVKGQIEISNSQAIINLFQGKYDQSTLLHETAHYFLGLINNLAEENIPIAETMIKEIREWTASFENKIGELTHERFARGYEQYIRSGNYTNNNPILKDVYDYFKSFLNDIYRNAEDLKIDTNNKQMFEFFDKYITNPSSYINDNDWVYTSGDNPEKDKEEIKNIEEINSDKYNNNIDLTNTLILNQGNAKEKLREEIEKRIQKLKEEGIDDYQLMEEMLKSEFAQRILELHNKTVNELDKTNKEDINKQENNNKITKNSSESRYKINKQNEYLNKYNELYEKLSLLTNNINNKNNDDIDNNYNLKLSTDKQKEIINNINDFINKIFSKSLVEEQEYIKKIFEEKNRVRKDIEEQGISDNYDYGIHPYKNIQEMLDDFEKINKDNSYFKKLSRSRQIEERNSYGESVSDYELTYQEYDNIVNFRKKYLKDKINNLIEELNNQTKQIENLKKINETKQQTINNQYDLIKEARQNMEDFQKLQTELGTNIKTLTEVEKAMGIIRDVRLRNKIMKYSMGRSTEYVIKKVEEYRQKELKKDYQNSIDKILLSTIHISKRTGKQYGNVIYEDTGFFRELKEINKYSKRKAEEELVKLENNRQKGINNEPQTHYELKKQLLYFKSTDDIKQEFMNEILNNLGHFTDESKQPQEEIRKENLYNILKERKEVRDLIENNKIGKGILNLGSTLIGHFGNFKTLLEYVGGKKLADKLDILGNEMAYSQGIKQKQDKLFNDIRNILGTEDKIKEIFKNYGEIITTIHYKDSLTNDKDTIGKSYQVVELKTDIESLKHKIRREIEATDNNKNSQYLIDLLESIEPTQKKGNNKNYKYKFTNGELSNLMNIIDHIQFKNDNEITEDIQNIRDTIKTIEEKEYNSTLENYQIDTWGLMYYDLLKRNKQTNDLINRYYLKDDISKMDELIASKGEEFKEIEEILFEAVQDREEINPYYILEFNKDMGQVENYFPRRSIHENEISLFDTLTSQDIKDKKVSAIESRSKDAIPNFNYNPLILTLSHQRQTEYVKNIAPKLKNIQNIFNTTIKDIISEKKGKDITNAIQSHIDNLKDGYNTSTTDMEKIMSYFIGNWSKSVTNTPSVLIKQMTSFMPYSEGLPITDFLYNYAKGIISPIKTKDFMKSISPYINERFNQDKYRDILKIIIETNRDGTINPIINILENINDKIKISDRTLTEIGDMLSVIYGGYARYVTQIETNKLTKEEALRDFEKQTIETQQSNFKSLQGRNTIKQGLFGRLANMFTSQDSQYFQKLLQLTIETNNKDINKDKLINNLLIYHFLTPLLLTMAGAGIDALYGRRKKSWLERIGQFSEAILLSFVPISFLSQSVAIDLSFNSKQYIKGFKKYENYLFNTLGAIFGKPIQTYWKMFFDRYYDSPFDLYDSDKEKQKKRKRK